MSWVVVSLTLPSRRGQWLAGGTCHSPHTGLGTVEHLAVPSPAGLHDGRIRRTLAVDSAQSSFSECLLNV